jgi:hypothetical protein
MEEQRPAGREGVSPDHLTVLAYAVPADPRPPRLAPRAMRACRALRLALCAGAALSTGCAIKRADPGESNLKLAYRSLWNGLDTVRYCVDATFQGWRPVVQELTAAAIADWQQYAQVTYTEVACNGAENLTVTMTTDPSSARGSATFPTPGYRSVLTLKLLEGDGQLLANGELRRDRTYGVLLHEIGHTLGFDHEHEADRGTELTVQDGRSIMYYPFEQGSWHRAGWADGWDRARLSLLDKIGAMTAYPAHKLLAPSNASPEVISEETGPAVCPPGAVANAIACYGDYCDDLRVFCIKAHPTPVALDAATAPNAAAFVTAVQCHGRWCDQVTATRTRFQGLSVGEPCYTSPPITDKPGPEGQGYHHVCRRDHAITDLSCSGQRCSEIRVRCCPAR